MSQEVNDLVEGMDRLWQVSFMDLPDDIIVDIFKLLDLSSQLKMRVNKRLNELQCTVKNVLEEIEINLNSDESELTVTPTTSFAYPRPLELDQLEQGIRRLTANCKIARISIGIADFGLNEDYDRLLEILFSVEADTLCIYPWQAGIFIGAHVNVPNPLDFSQRFRDISIDVFCDSMTVQDLIALRKLMLEGPCKLEWFNVDISLLTRKIFVKDCFGVEIEESLTPHGRCTIYQCDGDLAEPELYVRHEEIYDELKNIEGGLLTSINLDRCDVNAPNCGITFRKCDEKPIAKNKLRLNHRYYSHHADLV
ncbi:hypothetical protein PRIPAC_85510 [Pristionchus pacificus]|uniref:Uncharacterized protein n=1 Tax=Pristionchus pacificus TaxID=54126 RepID=A0A454Y1R0_PRIPA|nr:hypothetical protein PRIPAC_85510 [Pristionchus pacificus]|eukprot:PDM76565.1 hypothetical protein PRIPAC_42931 [Pristionchus pacificus]